MRVSACVDPYMFSKPLMVSPRAWPSPCAPGRQVHVDPCVRPPVIEGVVARPADEPVSARTAPEQVVAGIADEGVGMR